MKKDFCGGEFEVTFNLNLLPGDVPVKVRDTRTNVEEEVLWQRKYSYVHPKNTHFPGYFREMLREFLEKTVAVTKEPTADSHFVLLQNGFGMVFFTTYCFGDDIKKIISKNLAHSVVGYIETMEAAQIFMFGKSTL
jgi:hypothetical protein